jgi:YidC/Oxa1 family membrane protein insertase
VIPILAVLTTLLSSWLSMKLTSQTNKDSNSVMQQRIMMFAMPIMMGAFTVFYPVGVGIYWIASSVFQVVQQVFLNQKYGVGLTGKEDTKKHVG